MRTRIKRLERLYNNLANGNGTELTPEQMAEVATLVLSWVVEDACLEAMGVPREERFPLPANWESLKAKPAVKAEVERRLPVLRAWRSWYEVHRASYVGKLRPRDWANWDWAVRAVYVLRRDGTRGVPEAEALLEAANHAQVGSPEEERYHLGVP